MGRAITVSPRRRAAAGPVPAGMGESAASTVKSTATAVTKTVAKKAKSNAKFSTKPSLRHERSLLRAGHTYVAGMDEVGRGALAGPVTVGVVVVAATTPSAPVGVRDSKLLTPAVRETLVPKLQRWAAGYAVGHASNDEIDEYGIITALRMAGRRALAQLPLQPSCIVLDGSFNWLRSGAGDDPQVVTMVKGDMRCAAVAAASVLAKVERDGILTELAQQYPVYGWDGNKGYCAPEHVAALEEYGPCELHRRSWRLPGIAPVEDPQPALDLGLVESLDGEQIEADQVAEVLATGDQPRDDSQAQADEWTRDDDLAAVGAGEGTHHGLAQLVDIAAVADSESAGSTARVGGNNSAASAADNDSTAPASRSDVDRCVVSAVPSSKTCGRIVR